MDTIGLYRMIFASVVFVGWFCMFCLAVGSGWIRKLRGVDQSKHVVPQRNWCCSYFHPKSLNSTWSFFVNMKTQWKHTCSLDINTYSYIIINLCFSIYHLHKHFVQESLNLTFLCFFCILLFLQNLFAATSEPWRALRHASLVTMWIVGGGGTWAPWNQIIETNQKPHLAMFFHH